MASFSETKRPEDGGINSVVVVPKTETEIESDSAGAAGVIDGILKTLANTEHFSDVDQHLKRLNTSCHRCRVEEQGKAQRFIKWASKRQHLKTVKSPVPAGVLPQPYEGELCDVKVFTKHGPDDKIFENNEDIREKVARGNSFLELSGGPESGLSCVVYALKKFTGGLGDDDQKEKGDNFTWKKFFTKALDETQKVVCTGKANGEAAHLSCLEIAGKFVICGGSKNVHMLIRNKKDIELYTLPRYSIAKEVCYAIMDVLDNMGDDDRNRLLRFLVVTRFTAIFEILSPAHQHVENLSYLKSPKLVFITWTSSELEPASDAQLSPLPPHVAIEVARGLGLETVDYTIIPYSDVEERMAQVRRGYNYEGEVFYFLDSSSNVIGLLKKKTAWYILCRAIREKARWIGGMLAKSPETFSLSHLLNKVEKRLSEIQEWLSLDETYISQWKDLAVKFTKWFVNKMENNQLKHSDISELFPVTWGKFLQDSGLTDKISFGETSAAL